jgi:hypothetical protein
MTSDRNSSTPPTHQGLMAFFAIVGIGFSAVMVFLALVNYGIPLLFHALAWASQLLH